MPACRWRITCDSVFSHSSFLVGARRGRSASEVLDWRVLKMSTEAGGVFNTYRWLSRDGFNVSTCQAAMCHPLSSHSIIRPETADGITCDEADAQLGTHLGLWGDAQLNLKCRSPCHSCSHVLVCVAARGCQPVSLNAVSLCLWAVINRNTVFSPAG